MHDDKELCRLRRVVSDGVDNSSQDSMKYNGWAVEARMGW